MGALLRCEVGFGSKGDISYPSQYHFVQEISWNLKIREKGEGLSLWMLTGLEDPAVSGERGRGVPVGVPTTVGIRRIFLRCMLSCAHILFAFRMSATLS
jgi:hypothetical protein